MSLNEPRSIHAAEDWGVVIQSIPSKKKKEIVKSIETIFELDKHDAERALVNMPLILVDNLSFGLAARLKKYFQKLGAVVETTNHDMIKKNCFQIVWPQMPDLSFFLKDETKSPEIPAQEKSKEVKPAEEKLPEPPDVKIQFQPAPAEKPAAPPPSEVDLEWEQRAKDLHEKLRKIQEEKEQQQDQQAKAAERAQSEFQQQLDQEKQKHDGIAKAYEDLQQEARKQDGATQEGKEWRSKAMALSEKVRELEAKLAEKSSEAEDLLRHKEDLSKQLEKVSAKTQQELETLRGREQEFLRKIKELERNVQEMNGSLQSRDETLNQFEKQLQALTGKAQEYETLRQEHAQLVQERAGIRKEYDAKFTEQEGRLAKVEDDHRRYRSRADRKNAAATRELGEWARDVDALRQGLQKLIVFLGSESEVLDTEKPRLKSPLTRGANNITNGDRKKNLK